jgi:hypothetical protein
MTSAERVRRHRQRAKRAPVDPQLLTERAQLVAAINRLLEAFEVGLGDLVSALENLARINEVIDDKPWTQFLRSELHFNDRHLITIARLARWRRREVSR